MDAQQADVLPAGARLENFEIVRALDRARGGTIAYLATDTQSGKPVEIAEYLPVAIAHRVQGAVTPRTAGDRTVFDAGLKAFVDSAAALARLNHPGLARTLRTIQANGTAYAVTEQLDGTTLSELLKRENIFDEGHLKSILLPLADSLELAHAAGVLHCGIAPDNIVLRPNGSPTLVGFGAASSAQPSAGYAPVEQISGNAALAPSTDIYALGAVAYRLISGRRPIDASSRAEKDTLRPALEIGSGSYHRSLLLAVDWALKMDPGARPRNLAQWKDALLGLRDTVLPSGVSTTAPLTATMVRKVSEMRESKQAPRPPPAAPRASSVTTTPIPPPLPEARTVAPKTAPPAAAAPGPSIRVSSIAPAPRQSTPPPRPPPPRDASRSSLLAGIAAVLVLLATATYWRFGSRLTPSTAPATPNIRALQRPPAPTVPTAPTAPPSSAQMTPPALPAKIADATPAQAPAPAAATAAPPGAEKAPTQTPRKNTRRRAARQEAAGQGDTFGVPVVEEVADKPTVAELLPKVKGKWGVQSSYSVTLPGGSCTAQVKRNWAFNFARPSGDGEAIDGSFKTSFAVSAVSGSDCPEFYYTNDVNGDLKAKPQSASTLQLSAKPAKCSGDCDDTAGVFDWHSLNRSFRFTLSDKGDRLNFSDGEREYTLKRSKTFLFW